MNDYSIENSSKYIKSEKTKVYFKEVSSSYYNGNYRAAVVTLYSVVINDLLLKLESLEEIFSDEAAKKILEEIKKIQEKNPKSGDWEKDLVEKIRDRTDLIDNINYAHILALRNDRHFCAHPVISNKNDKLYTPNKETVSAHIRNMLESIFIKPPVLSKKILKTIVVDIAKKKDILIDDDTLEKYLKAKYLTNLTPKVELSLFRSLWKFVFYIDDEPCNDNRGLNYRVLFFLYSRNTAACISSIKSEQEYYSNIIASSEIVNFLILFLSQNGFLYSEFREDVIVLIKNQVEADFNAKIVAWFLNDSFLEHLENLENASYEYHSSLEASAYKRLFDIGKMKGHKKDVLSFFIRKYTKSSNYTEAAGTFNLMLEPNLDSLTEADFKLLCEGSNENTQTYERWKSHESHKKIKDTILHKLGEGFDFSLYPNLFD